MEPSLYANYDSDCRGLINSRRLRCRIPLLHMISGVVRGFGGYERNQQKSSCGTFY